MGIQHLQPTTAKLLSLKGMDVGISLHKSCRGGGGGRSRHARVILTQLETLETCGSAVGDGDELHTLDLLKTPGKNEK